MKEVQKVKILDGWNKQDSLKSVRGKVIAKVIDKNGNIIERKKSNTVVIYGRNSMFQRLTNITHTVKLENGTSINDARGFVLNFFAIGSGGAPTSDPFNPIAPKQTDFNLANYIHINASGNAVCNDTIHKQVDSKIFSSDTEMVVTFTVNFNDANPNENGNPNRVFINEACLSLSDKLTVANALQFVMFTRATFSTIEKNPDRKIEFEWHLYF